MIYFRLIHQHHQSTPLGYGFAGGRWNLPGVPMIYASNITSLNFLELLSIKGAPVADEHWILVQLQIKTQIPHLDGSELPQAWKNRPYPKATQYFGTEWAQKFISPFLKIPSCRIPLINYPQEHNLLINPIHPDFRKLVAVKAAHPVDFALNPNH